MLRRVLVETFTSSPSTRLRSVDQKGGWMGGWKERCEKSSGNGKLERAGKSENKRQEKDMMRRTTGYREVEVLYP